MYAGRCVPCHVKFRTRRRLFFQGPAWNVCLRVEFHCAAFVASATACQCLYGDDVVGTKYVCMYVCIGLNFEVGSFGAGVVLWVVVSISVVEAILARLCTL